MLITLGRCVATTLKKTPLKASAFKYTALRTLLSASYISEESNQLFSLPRHGAGEMALQTLSLDRCHERDMPVSSMMIDRMVRAIENKQHLTGSLYYLHKFRHSQNGYYIQPWTTHAFVCKCLKIDVHTLLEALKQKNQYGLFPDKFAMALVVDHFLKEKNILGATEAAGEMFLLETLDNKISQALAVKAVSEYWKEFSTENELLPTFKDSTLRRNIFAVLYCVGKYLSHPSLIVTGQSLLGKIEQEHGILSLYFEPWGPLSPEPGYLMKAIEYVNTLEENISQQSIDILLHCAAGNENLEKLAQAACDSAKEKNIVSEKDELTLPGIAELLVKDLHIYEREDLKRIQEDFSSWSSDLDRLEEIEKEILSEFKTMREEYYRKLKIEEKSHQMAVETLGYWDMAKNKDNAKEEESEEKEVFYLRSDYVEGAMHDLDLVERLRESRSIVVNPVFLHS